MSAPHSLQAAITHQMAGRLPEAEALYRKILEAQPDQPDALYLLGMVAYEAGRNKTAVELIGRALSFNPRFVEGHNNIGLALHQLGRYAEAASHFSAALALRPDYADAHSNLGLTLYALGERAAAVEHFQMALSLKPDPETHNNLGNAFRAQGRPEDALASFERAISLRPDYAEACCNRGLVLHETGQPAAALASFDRALSLKPDYAEAHNHRGLALQKLKRAADALQSFDAAITLKPDYTYAYLNRSNLLYEYRQPEAALKSADLALALEPDYAEAHNSRAAALNALNQPEAALAAYDRAIALKPDYAEAYNNRGIALKNLGRPEAALDSYERALPIRPDFADAHWNKAFLHLLQGNFERGWAGYEWRWKVASLEMLDRNFAQPLWLGEEPLAGKTILLHAEQGLGDTLQFCRYAKKVTGLGARVVLEAQKPLLGLLRRLEGVSELVEFGSPPPAFDYHCPMLSLPLAFGTDMGSIPDEMPYLSADAGRVAKWRARLPGKNRPRAGLVWSGSTAHKNDRNRSVPLSDLLKILPEGFDYVSLQKELRETDQITLQARPDIPHFGAELADFDDTAALCELVDVVISVDTSVAHLAGALGRPVCILLPHIPDWRWLLVRADSPWYPSARLYRQEKTGDWRDAFERLAAGLRGIK